MVIEPIVRPKTLNWAIKQGHVPKDARIGHIWYDRKAMTYDRDSRKTTGLLPVHIHYEDTDESEFVCLVRWRRNESGLIIIDQREFYTFDEGTTQKE